MKDYDNSYLFTKGEKITSEFGITFERLGLIGTCDKVEMWRLNPLRKEIHKLQDEVCLLTEKVKELENLIKNNGVSYE